MAVSSVTSRVGLIAAAGAAGLTRNPLGQALTVGRLVRSIRAGVLELSRDPVVLAAVVCSLASGLLISALVVLEPGSALPAGLLVPGAVGLIGGAGLFWFGWRGPGQARFRWLAGLALAVWALGQVVNGVFALPAVPAVPSFPSLGNAVSVLATPFALAAVLAVPWPGRLPHSGGRLALDSALLGVSVALPLWHFVFERTVGPSAASGRQLVAAVVLVAEATLVCLGLLAYLRDFDAHVLIIALGITCYTVGDLINLGSLLAQPQSWIPAGTVLCALSWPLITAGLYRFRPSTGNERGDLSLDLDGRGLIMSTTISLALLVATLTAMMASSTVDRISIGLVIVTALVFWARELLNSRFRAQLLHELHAEATADPLTGLANRRVLADRMEALSQGDSWCLLTVDLDGFKDVNDLLGHGTGDRLLAAVAHRLREATPPEALVSRIGGDEFAVLLPGDIEVGARVGAAIVTAVRQSAADVEGVARVEVSASVGVAAVHGHGHAHGSDHPVITLPPADPLPPDAPYDPGPRQHGETRPPQSSLLTPARGWAPAQARARTPAHEFSRLGSEPVTGDDAEFPVAQDLLADRPVLGAAPHPAVRPARGTATGPPPDGPVRATPEVVDPLSALSASSAALRVAKAAGRNRVEIYDAAVAQIRRRRLRVEERLRSAVETGAITVQYQPIIDLRHGQMAGCEALARWVDPELGRVDPGEFITVAEQTGLVVAIGERVLHETLRNAVAAGLFERGMRVACNVSPVQLRVPGFDRVVQEAIAAHGVPRDQLVIEVTEQVLVEEGQAAQTLHRLAALGLTIAIDDFGTGYSALGYLQRLPADILKIDQSLTSSLIAEPRSRAITRAVVDLGRTVGLSVVVEGVESGQLDDLVRRMGVGFGQGLYYGAAMDAPALAAMADRLASNQ